MISDHPFLFYFPK